MTSLQLFESTLKELLESKRLSASKMTKLTDTALKSMDEDTQLVSILYRTHKSLQTAAKVNSLYAFDALSRAARSYANKHNLTGDINSKKGNCFTFLQKVEGVLDGLIQDMVSSDNPELKEKCKKVLDIWVKANTFPATVLSRLAELLKGSREQESKQVASVTAVGVEVATTTTPPVQTSAPAVGPVQSTLLALLSQAATASTAAPIPGQTTPNIPLSSAPQLDNAQLLLLQTLAQTAKLNSVSTSSPVAASPPVVPLLRQNGEFGRNGSGSGPYRDDGYSSGDADYSRDRFGDHAHERSSDSFQRDRPFRGYRGGYRGRGRGRGRWDDRDDFRGRDRDAYQDRDRDFGFSPNSRTRRSRSRSPRGRYAGRRDIKPYSPPRRPSLKTDDYSQITVPMMANSGLEKDEFGRDIRPASPLKLDAVSSPTKTEEFDKPMEAAVEPASELPSNQRNIPTSVASIPSSSQNPDAPGANSGVAPQQHGLDKFDLSTFDFTSPTAWEGLGKMWQVTYGYPPSQEKLMQFIISGGVIPATNVASNQPQQQNTIQVWSGDDRIGGLGEDSGGLRGRGRGRGQGQGFGRGRGGRGGRGYNSFNRSNQEHWGCSTPNQESDAVVLGGGTTEDQDGSDDMQITPEKSPQQSPSAGGGPGGRMQRVGDRWIFVRDNAVIKQSP